MRNTKKLTINNLHKLEGSIVVVHIPYSATSNESVELSIGISAVGVKDDEYYELYCYSAVGQPRFIIYRRIVDGHLFRVEFDKTHYCFISVNDIIHPDLFLEILESKRWIPN
jgi:hypothetical protein